MSKNQSYWENRKARELYEELVSAEETAEEMRQLYIRASDEIQEQARRILKRFQLKHGLSVAEAERLLRKIRDPEDLAELIRLLKLDPKNAELIAELEAPAYAARLNRLIVAQAGVDQVAQNLLRRAEPKLRQVLEKIGRGMYYRQIFDMQQRANAAFPFMPVDEERLEQILNTRWSGRNFSEVLWGNTEELAAEVKRQILLSILTGKSQRAMSQAIDGRFSKGYNNTRRLVRTEANYVANQMQLESYKAHSVEKYIYVAILDLRTSPICRDLDKQVFEIKDAQAGFNYPPMHPWCRSTTIAWMPKQLLKKLEQAAIDPETGETIQIPGDMTYREWYDKYVAGKESQFAQTRFAGTNFNLTEEQYRKYKTIFDSDIPDTIQDFIKMKSSEPEKWSRLKSEKQARLNEMPFESLAPLEQSLGPAEVRSWYKYQNSLIPEKIDRTLPLELQARQACDLRNQNKINARNLMKDQALRQQLDITDPLESFEQLLSKKMREKDLSRDQAIHDIINTSVKTRRSVDERYGLL